MRLYRAARWYNPFSIEVNNKYYTLDSISVFENGKIIARTNSGWFGSNNNYDEMFFDCDCVLKRKIDLNYTNAFIIKSENSYENRYDLYIPNSVVLLEAPTYKSVMSNNRRIVKTQKSSIIEGVVFEKHIFTDKEVSDIENRVRAIGKKIETSFGNDFNKITDYTRELCSLTIERTSKLKKLKDATIEELVAEYEVN